MIIADVAGLEGLNELLAKQFSFFNHSYDNRLVKKALADTEYCFSHVNNKYYRAENGECRFSPLNSAQYCVFLYFLSRAYFSEGDGRSACVAYLLNKTINAIDLFYEVEMPAVFAVEHPVGTVLGRAKYSDRFHVSQNVTIGNNHGIYPEFGENVTVHFGASVIGRTHIGHNVEIAANAYVKDEEIPSNSIVFGSSPNLTIKQKTEDEMKKRLIQFKYEQIGEGN